MAKKIWTDDRILQEDLERVAASDLIDWEQLRGKRVLVTGATGLIGSLLARSLVCASVERSLNIRVAALVRSPEKGKAMLGAFLEDGLELVAGDILSPLAVEGPVDYILHGASVTASKDFVDHPSETILTALKGTEHVLELAREKQVKSMVYLSSMEVYGVVDPERYVELPRKLWKFAGAEADPDPGNPVETMTGKTGGPFASERTADAVTESDCGMLAGSDTLPDEKEKKNIAKAAYTAAIVREADYGRIDPLQVRSSYSEGKRMAEGLCAAYAHEYAVPVKMARLAQTFGAGIPQTENRVFAQFARSIMSGSDIVLHTDGGKAHCYCYTTDAVLGLLTVLLRGENGEAYNVSNEDTYSSIRGMAQMLIERYPQSGSHLVFDIPADANKYGYAPTSRMVICSEKLNRLGWQAQIGLPEMFERLMGSMK
ncbi:MAG: NAD-dependent epimerase/dehydratase family protein [Lachnospiraceae bacterium]|nr:NAD-dependent epimerase/dehydratase family protein [Lachnospiraceae bacterium]